MKICSPICEHLPCKKNSVCKPKTLREGTIRTRDCLCAKGSFAARSLPAAAPSDKKSPKVKATAGTIIARTNGTEADCFPPSHAPRPVISWSSVLGSGGNISTLYVDCGDDRDAGQSLSPVLRDNKNKTTTKVACATRFFVKEDEVVNVTCVLRSVHPEPVAIKWHFSESNSPSNFTKTRRISSNPFFSLGLLLGFK